MKRSISKTTRLSLVGLLVLGERLNNQLMQVEQAMKSIVGEETEIGSSHCSDLLYGGGMTDDKEYDVDQLLKRLGVTVDE